MEWGRVMSYQTIFSNRRVTHDVTETRHTQTEAGSKITTSIKVGSEEVIYNVAIDLEELDQMAHRASHNKSQRSKDGAVLVEIVRRRRL